MKQVLEQSVQNTTLMWKHTSMDPNTLMDTYTPTKAWNKMQKRKRKRKKTSKEKEKYLENIIPRF